MACLLASSPWALACLSERVTWLCDMQISPEVLKASEELMTLKLYYKELTGGWIR